MSIPQEPEPPVVLPAPRSGSLTRGSAMRLVSDGSGVVLGTVSSAVTARVLGTEGKGTLAALTFVTLLVMQCCTLGLGDAAVVRIGQAKASAQEALSASLPAVLLASVAGAAVVLAYAVLQLPLGDAGIWAAVTVACLTVVVGASGQLLLFLALYARQRVIAVSVLTIAMSATATVGVVLFCVLVELDVLGGMLAGLASASVGFVVAGTVLARERIRLRPRLAGTYLRPALSFGLRAQLANVLAYSSARVDLLFVYALASPHEAGLYSVALTLGTITGFVAIALSFASFPSMTAMEDAQALELTATMSRVATLLGIVVAVVLAAMSSTLIAVLMGSEFTAALTATIVLLFANVLWGVQWLLSRALAARGDAGLLVRCFSANLLTMTVADVFLVPLAGATGAAVGALIGALAGLGVCLEAYGRRGVHHMSFVPRPADLQRVWSLARQAVRTARGGRAGR